MIHMGALHLGFKSAPADPWKPIDPPISEGVACFLPRIAAQADVLTTPRAMISPEVGTPPDPAAPGDVRRCERSCRQSSNRSPALPPAERVSQIGNRVRRPAPVSAAQREYDATRAAVVGDDDCPALGQPLEAIFVNPTGPQEGGDLVDVIVRHCLLLLLAWQ